MSTLHKEANPGPLGLLGFGTTTILLNLHNAGIINMSVVILSMGIMVGGMAQIIAGLMEFKNNNTFGATAFTSYGLFWLSLVIILTNPACLGGMAADGASLGFYFILWGIYTAFMFIATLKSNKATQFVFLSLAVLFVLLALEKWTGAEALGVILGWEGIICGASAVYAAVAQVINETFDRQVLPL